MRCLRLSHRPSHALKQRSGRFDDAVLFAAPWVAGLAHLCGVPGEYILCPEFAGGLEAELRGIWGMKSVTLFLCGDVMTGRGIDQALAHPSAPQLHESYVRSALEYVELAERAHGRIPKPVDSSYIWGEALPELARVQPAVRIVNLETSVTASEDWECKGINYRMHPDNAGCLTAAQIDCCVLANNHVLDWGHRGLEETLATLHARGIRTAGAGRTRAAAEAPAILAANETARVLVFAAGSPDSGIPRAWAAEDGAPGISVLPDFSERTAMGFGERIRSVKRPGDIAALSIHWGGNWGYEIPPEHRRFAHWLIDSANVDIVHGHSSHHPKAMEVHASKLILYGCGDFINDYEGIGGREEFRSQLVLMYFATLDPATGNLARLEMTPLETSRFCLRRPSGGDVLWLQNALDREAEKMGGRVALTGGERLLLL